MKAERVIVVTALALIASSWQGAESRAALEIRTLSSRPDLVSGGDTLVAIKAPAGTPVDQLSVTLNGKDVTARFTLDAASGEFRGLVEGLRLGANRLMATTKKPRSEAEPHRHQPRDHRADPFGSTPHAVRMQHGSLGPRTGARRQLLGAAQDLAPLSNDGQHVQAARDPAAPRPADVATTTTTDGKTVPYIVRVDSGVINRAIYQLAILDDLVELESQVRRVVRRQFRHAVHPGRDGAAAGLAASLNHQALVEGLRLPDLVGARERPPRQRRAAGRNADDDQGIHRRALRRAEVLHRQRRIGRRDPAARDHADVSGIARRPDAEPHLPGLESPHHRQHPADQPVAEAGQERVDAGEDHRGRGLHARHRAGVECGVRTARRADQRRRLRARRQDADLRSGHQSQGRALHDAGYSRQHLRARSEDRLGAAPDRQHRPAIRTRRAQQRRHHRRRIPRGQREGRRHRHRRQGRRRADGRRSDRAEEHVRERPQGVIQRGAWQRADPDVAHLHWTTAATFTIASATSWCARGCSAPTAVRTTR